MSDTTDMRFYGCQTPATERRPAVTTETDGGAAVPCISLLDIVAELKSQGMRCNCDLDNWEPERDTGHSWVCRIHKTAKARMSNAGAKARGNKDMNITATAATCAAAIRDRDTGGRRSDERV